MAELKSKSKPKPKEKKLKEIAVELWKTKKHLCEIGQTTGIHYAFLSSKEDGYRQCHQWIKCRDFLHDALRNQVTGKKDYIYGFSYEKGVNPPIDTKKMRITVKRCEVNNTRDILEHGLAIIHCVEKHSGIKPLSKMYEATCGEQGVYIFEGAVDWVESTFMISLYTFFIRLGAKKIEFKDKEDLYVKLEKLCKTSYSDHDVSYLKTILPFLDKITKNRKKLKYVMKNGKSFFEDQTINMFHGYTGVVALCRQAVSKGTQNEKLKDLDTMSGYIKDKESKHERPKQMKKVAAKQVGV